MRYSLKDYSRTAAAKGWGRGWPTCDAQKQVARVTAPISGVSFIVHKRIARLFYLGLAEMERRGYLCRPGQCWGGNCRAIAGTDVPSNHSWWLAGDINSLANPYVAKRKGMPVTDMPAWLPLLWNSLGFAWGGDYSGTRADAMHVEFMGSPEDADEMTALAELRIAPHLDGAWVITDLLPTVQEDDMFDTTRDRATIENTAFTVGRLKEILEALLPTVRDEDAQTDSIDYAVGNTMSAVGRIELAIYGMKTAQAVASATAAGLTREQVAAAVADANRALLADLRVTVEESVKSAVGEADAGLAGRILDNLAARIANPA